uniref:Uncharacterized protein n=1 Tax=Eptatretus burgeri TaxID=7764 RepID=A0A8C4QLC2_EPTBU
DAEAEEEEAEAGEEAEAETGEEAEAETGEEAEAETGEEAEAETGEEAEAETGEEAEAEPGEEAEAGEEDEDEAEAEEEVEAEAEAEEEAEAEAEEEVVADSHDEGLNPFPPAEPLHPSEDILELNDAHTEAEEDNLSVTVQAEDAITLDFDGDLLLEAPKKDSVAGSERSGVPSSSRASGSATSAHSKGDGAGKKDEKESGSSLAKNEDKDGSKRASSPDRAKKSTASSASMGDQAKRFVYTQKKTQKTRESGTLTLTITLTCFDLWVIGAKIVTSARSPGSRCYGFITMTTSEEATLCMSSLHRTELHGHMISVEKVSISFILELEQERRDRRERERLRILHEREERDRVQRERTRLQVERVRREKERLERERLERELMRIEQERRREQERIAREREELRRQQEQLRIEQERHAALKRPFEVDSRRDDGHWGDAKRLALDSDAPGAMFVRGADVVRSDIRGGDTNRFHDYDHRERGRFTDGHALTVPSIERCVTGSYLQVSDLLKPITTYPGPLSRASAFGSCKFICPLSAYNRHIVGSIYDEQPLNPQQKVSQWFSFLLDILIKRIKVYQNLTSGNGLKQSFSRWSPPGFEITKTAPTSSIIVIKNIIVGSGPWF